MPYSFKGAIVALSLGVMTLTGVVSTAAVAQPDSHQARERREDRREVRQDQRNDRREYRQARQDDRRHDRVERRVDRREDRRDWRNARRDDYRRPARVVYGYDYNRPDPRYGRYYRPDRYYRTGYAPIRVTRSTRIYRGNDDRYYCRRSDGTTGLIIGAALGGLIGSQVDRGRSNTAGILIGGGSGALLGREIDRGSLNCR